MNSDGLDEGLRDRVLERLGFRAAPAADLPGLEALYKAWCAAVPFDNVRKMIALRGQAAPPLPGAYADDFFENWLAHGVGGTCWPTSNALYELLRAVGFAARRCTASMRDLGLQTHATVKVAVDGADWLVDGSMLTEVPLPLGPDVFVHTDAVFASEVEPDAGTHVVWCDMPPNSMYIPCRLLGDGVASSFYLESYEKSRERGPFNQRLYARRNLPGELLVLLGNMRFSKTRAGLASRVLSRAEVCLSLRAEIGLSGTLVEAWVQSGALEASSEPPSGPTPPPITRLPPSKRPAA